MPTKHQRIAITNDEELSEALARVGPLFGGAPLATVVHDLAVKGADAALRERDERDAAIRRLIEWSTSATPELDREVLLHVRELAWGE